MMYFFWLPVSHSLATFLCFGNSHHIINNYKEISKGTEAINSSSASFAPARDDISDATYPSVPNDGSLDGHSSDGTVQQPVTYS